MHHTVDCKRIYFNYTVTFLVNCEFLQTKDYTVLLKLALLLI